MLKNVHSILLIVSLFFVFETNAISEDFKDIIDSREFQKLEPTGKSKIIIPEDIDRESEYAHLFYDGEARKQVIQTILPEEKYLTFSGSKLNEELVIIESLRKKPELSVKIFIPTPSYVTRSKYSVITKLVDLDLRNYNCDVLETIKLANSPDGTGTVCKYKDKKLGCAFRVNLSKGAIAWVAQKKCSTVDSIVAAGSLLRYNAVDEILRN